MANQSISQRPSAGTLQDHDLIPISQKQPNGSYLTCKVTADKLKGESAYQQWFNYNTSENTYLTLQSIYQLQQSSNYSTVSNFVTATNLTNAYNTWLQTSIDVQDNYITENELTVAFNTFIQENNAATFNDFLVSENLISNFNNWTVTNKTSLLTLFMQISPATFVYKSYVTLHPNATPAQFLAAIGADDGFAIWLSARVDKLTEAAFNSALTGKNGKSASPSKHEKFWISICAIYEPAPVDVEPPVEAS